MPNPLAQRICGLTFLIGQLKTESVADTGVRATAEHIAALMVGDLTADDGKPRSDVAVQLNSLADEGVHCEAVGDFGAEMHRLARFLSLLT